MATLYDYIAQNRTQNIGTMMQQMKMQEALAAQQQRQKQQATIGQLVQGIQDPQMRAVAEAFPEMYAQQKAAKAFAEPKQPKMLQDAQGRYRYAEGPQMGQVVPGFEQGKAPEGFERGPDGRLVAIPEYWEQKKAVSRSGAANISNTVVNEGERAYTKKGSELAVQEDTEQFKRAQTAANNIGKLDDVINHLKTSDAITGFGAEMFKDLERMRAQFLRSKQANKNASDTELLDTMLGSDVFPMIQSLGIGARGMDTPAEREFLRQVMTGTVSMNKDTLLRMAEMRRKAAESEVGRWNQRTEAGELDRWYEAFGRQKQPFDLKPRGGGKPQGEQQQRPRAKNPQTGEVIEWNGTQWVPVK